MAFLLTQLKDLYISKRGFHTDRKLVVFESDDWGSIRMPSKSVFEKLRAFGDSPEKDGYLSNDCLESEDDLKSLFDVLGTVSDSKGNNPIFTLNFATANPSFDKIDYENGIYEYEPFYETYDSYYGKNSILELIKEGYAKKLILPQLHCREHLNVGRWMRDLKAKKPDAILAFEHKTMGVGASFHALNQYGYMDAFNTDCSTNEELDAILKDANKIFVDTFGFQSSTFVASCFVWNDKLEESLKDIGINHIQCAPWQNKAVGTSDTYKLKRIIRYTGQRNRKNQMYSVRNCSYEPAYRQNPEECVKSCIEEISASFKSKKPAIISSHRFNYIGSINPKNRENNLSGLKELLKLIVERYPDVEFISSVELFSIMEKEKK